MRGGSPGEKSAYLTVSALSCIVFQAAVTDSSINKNPFSGTALLTCTLLFFGLTSDAPAQVRVKDIAPMTEFQDAFLGHFNRGRASIAADFDLDGFLDFYIGNPGDKLSAIQTGS